MAALESSLDGRGLRIAVLVSRFNHLISRRLLDACELRLKELSCEDPEVVWVPGAFELPLAAQSLAERGGYDALVALGVVIRGGTPHFDYVCRAVTDGLRKVGLRARLPVAFGVLTTDTLEQALERSVGPGEQGSNKGSEVAEVAVEMARLIPRLCQRS